MTLPPVIAPRQHSRPEGALVLAALPPFFHDDWMGAGLVRLHHELSGNDLAPRLVRPLPELGAVPPPVQEGALRTLALDRPLAERLAEGQAFGRAFPELIEALLEALLAGPETIFAFSVWRTNVDLSLEICRQLRERRPEAHIVLGGPEAIERGPELRGPWADVVVSGAGEGVIVPLVRALQAGVPGRARRLAHTWVDPRYVDDGAPLAPGRPYAALGPVDFRPLVPLLLPDPRPRLSALLNVGCVFNCGFCTNRLVYPELGWGAVETCVEEIRHASALWAEAFPDPAARPALTVELCDATINGWPEQFDRLCQGLAAADMPARPRLSANIIVDQRLHQGTAEAMAVAGFTDLFFGLESGSDRIRRKMKKPGSVDRVWKSLAAADAASQDRLHVGFGVIVGWPDETEAEYQETLDLLQRISSLSALRPSANVSPLFRSRNAQDEATMAALEGAAYGVMWRAEGPAGDPAERCRRMMGVVERFHGRMPVDCPVPVERLARWMLPPQEQAALDRWEKVYSSKAARPPSQEEVAPGSTAPPVLPDPLAELRLRRLFSLGPDRDALLVLRRLPDRAELVLFEAPGRALLALILRPRDEDADCFARTPSLNVSLVGESHAPEKLALVERILERVRRREALA